MHCDVEKDTDKMKCLLINYMYRMKNVVFLKNTQFLITVGHLISRTFLVFMNVYCYQLTNVKINFSFYGMKMALNRYRLTFVNCNAIGKVTSQECEGTNQNRTLVIFKVKKNSGSWPTLTFE